ncbi:MAG: hypothetical protein LN417_05315, partial [Candidatus Thermoplasmatota archaeon]|nr:hypothetical protein [Candidatus Thermoplasmatota archaeon]
KDNEIYGNWIEGSTLYAIWLNCTGCRVWNNSFINNPIMFGTSQAVDELGSVHWNESYPIGGNYWSDYGGPDMFNGPGQNIPGSDGIGDVPYPIYDATFDYYPLVIPTPPMPDLVVDEGEIVFDPPDPVQEGESVDIYAAIRNTGMANAINVVVRFFDGDPGSGVQIDGDQTIGLLPLGGGKEWVKVTWTANGIGQHQICVLTDPDDLVKESDEANNEACKSIDVTQAGPPSPPADLRAHLSGVDRENVTITWSLSPDDSGGKSNVVRYDIHRGENHSSNISAYDLHDSVPNATSEYVDAGAGEGDPSDHFYRVCAVDLSNNSACAEDQAAKFTHSLTRGPNLISIPLIQSNESIETVLQTVAYDRAWSYDSASQGWKWYMTSKAYRRGLWSVNHTVGLWVNVTRDSNLTVAGLVPTSTHIRLSSGWNLVGFPCFNGSYSVADMKVRVGSSKVEGFDSIDPYRLRVLPDSDMLRAGYAYWIKVESETVWILINE